MIDGLGSLVEDGITIGGLVVANQAVAYLIENLQDGELMVGSLIDGSLLVENLPIGGLVVTNLANLPIGTVSGGLVEVSGRVTTIGLTHVHAITLILWKEVDHRGVGVDRRGVGVGR
jgi:hypothetical protein